MRVEGLVFVGTRSRAAAETVPFATDVLGLVPRAAHGHDAAFFDLPDGSVLAVQPVDDDEPAARELRAAGHAVDDVARAGDLADVHVRAPDGRLWELVQRLPVDAGQQAGEHHRSA